MRRFALALIAVLALPASAAAKGGTTTIAPPGNSGVSQYVETVPTAHGGQPTSSVHKGGGGSGHAQGGGGPGGSGGGPGGRSDPAATQRRSIRRARPVEPRQRSSSQRPRAEFTGGRGAERQRVARQPVARYRLYAPRSPRRAVLTPQRRLSRPDRLQPQRRAWIAPADHPDRQSAWPLTSLAIVRRRRTT